MPPPVSSVTWGWLLEVSEAPSSANGGMGGGCKNHWLWSSWLVGEQWVMPAAALPCYLITYGELITTRSQRKSNSAFLEK